MKSTLEEVQERLEQELADVRYQKRQKEVAKLDAPTVSAEKVINIEIIELDAKEGLLHGLCSDFGIDVLPF